MKWWEFIVILILVYAVLYAYHALTTNSIQDISQHPERYVGKNVTVEGYYGDCGGYNVSANGTVQLSKTSGCIFDEQQLSWFSVAYLEAKPPMTEKLRVTGTVVKQDDDYYINETGHTEVLGIDLLSLISWYIQYEFERFVIAFIFVVIIVFIVKYVVGEPQ